MNLINHSTISDLFDLSSIYSFPVLPYAYRRIRTAENWVMRTPQTLYQQVCKHSVLPVLAEYLVCGYLLPSPTSYSVAFFGASPGLPTTGLEPVSPR